MLSRPSGFVSSLPGRRHACLGNTLSSTWRRTDGARPLTPSPAGRHHAAHAAHADADAVLLSRQACCPQVFFGFFFFAHTSTADKIWPARLCRRRVPVAQHAVVPGRVVRRSFSSLRACMGLFPLRHPRECLDPAYQAPVMAQNYSKYVLSIPPSDPLGNMVSPRMGRCLPTCRRI